MCDYSMIVSTAEGAVAKLTNEDLKTIAFAEILRHLLYGSDPTDRAKTRTNHSATKHHPNANGERKRTGLPAWLRELKDEGFFEKPKSQSVIHDELKNRNHHIPITSLPAGLAPLVRTKVLRRTKMSPTEGQRPVYHWSNWG